MGWQVRQAGKREEKRNADKVTEVDTVSVYTPLAHY